MQTLTTSATSGTVTCPSYSATDHVAAPIANSHHEQGWIRLANGVIVFDDGGEILPDGRTVAAHRAEPAHRQVVAA